MGKKKMKQENKGQAQPKEKRKPEPLKGTFEQNLRGFGFIKPDIPGDGIFVSQYETGGAIHGDRVEYEMFNDYDDYLCRPKAIIRKVLEEGHKHIVGMFHYQKRNSYVVPLDKKYGCKIRVLKKYHNNAQDHQLVVAAVKRPGDLLWMDGRIVEVLGFPNDPGVRVLGMVKQSEVPYEFPKNVLKEAKQVQTSVTPAEAQTRRRIEGPVITIDGEDTKDVDDAISLRKDESGIYTLGVHIADVNAYVKENTELDKEALRRGTSIYLADRTIPMLPQELSNGICSLNEGVDRLALSCIMGISADGDLISHNITESVINVGKHMTYPDVNAVLGGLDVPGYTDYLPMLKLMEELCLILKRKREGRGAISFDLPESKAELDENGRALDIRMRERGIASEIIEEFMLICNETVAVTYNAKELPFVYRVHEPPELDKLSKLNEFAGSLGYRMKAKTRQIASKDIQQLMAAVCGKPEEGVITKMALRSLKRAQYSSSNQGHYGLAAEFYCHFTSPIRRYPDLQIHRIIKEDLRGLTAQRKEELSLGMPSVSRASSMTERRAEVLEREVLQLKKCEYMRQFIGDEFEGIISGVTSWGIFVELPNTVEGIVRIHDLSEPFEYNEQHMALLGMFSGRMYKLGNAVKIAVARVDLELRQIEFALRKSANDIRAGKKKKGRKDVL